ncbi:MAG: OmpA family protein [Propionibacteriaceae bacterium]|nr:OmpA family protein [Propionibacteriaceae bacterium]
MSNTGKKAGIVITGLLLATTLIGGSLVGQELLARNLQPKAEAALADAGFTNIEVKFKGREAYITGHDKTDVELERARLLVEDINGVRWAKISGDNTSTGDPTGTPANELDAIQPAVNISTTDSGIVLTGTVSTQEEADALEAEALRVFGPPVDNQLVVDPECDDQMWVSELSRALGSSPTISGGSLEATSENLSLTGEVATEEDLAKVEAALGTVGIPYTNNLTVAAAPAPTPTEEPDLTDAEIAQINKTVVSYAMRSYGLDSAGKSQLDKIVPLLKKTDRTLTVRGYLSDPHKPELQARDSKARAQSVADYLISKGVPSSRIIVEGHGIADPIASNATAEGRAANQRATLTLS